ncbi:enterobactin synthase subunit EntD [Salmonella enterica]
MQTTHHTLSLANQTLHQIDFSPVTFVAADLLWLPHHRDLIGSGRKRLVEHLAGRIAAVHALQEWGYSAVPGIGAQGQPCWPAGLYGSISHSENSAIAVVSRQGVGIDIESLFSDELCAELRQCIVNDDEFDVLQSSSFPLPLALTLAFSAKESLFKAFSHLTYPLPGFASAQIIALDQQKIELLILPTFSAQLAGKKALVYWKASPTQVVTLCTQ